jgi:hypothetical protein
LAAAIADLDESGHTMREIAEEMGTERGTVPLRGRYFARGGGQPQARRAEIGFLAVLHTWGQTRWCRLK